MSYLLLTDATRYASESMARSAKVYVNLAQANVAKNLAVVNAVSPADLSLYKA